MLTLGSLFAFITYSVQVMNPISTVLNIKYIFMGITPSAKRFFDFLEECKNLKEPSGSVSTKKISKIEFKNVNFSYDNNNHILKDINFTIQQCDKIAIIGRKGSGKSTIFSLLERFYVPDSGEILVNGQDIRSYDLNSYRSQLGCMNQNFHLFDTSIKNNILLFTEDRRHILQETLLKTGEPIFMKTLENVP